MSKLVKKTLWALLIAFLVFYLVTRPESAADFVRGVFGIIDPIGRFFARLAR